MVSIVKVDTGNNTATITLTINEILDIVNGLNVMCANKEEEILRYNEGETEKAQLKRYEDCRSGMQQVKTALE